MGQGAAFSTSGPRFKRRPGYRNRKRLLGAVILTLGFIFVVIALAAPWWTISVDNHSKGFTDVIYFFPGTGVSATCSGTCTGGEPSGSSTYSATIPPLTNVGNLYGGVQGLMIGALLLSLVVASLAFLGAYGLNFGRMQLTLTILLGFLALALALGASIWAAAAQPGAMSADKFPFCFTGGSSVTNSFWGSQSGTCPNGAVIDYSWAAGAGWYSAMIGFAFLWAGTVWLLLGRKEPYSAAELGVYPLTPSIPPAPGPYVVAPPWVSPPPGPAPGYGSPVAPPPPPPPATTWGVPCPTCGATNPMGVPICWRCQRALR